MPISRNPPRFVSDEQANASRKIKPLPQGRFPLLHCNCKAGFLLAQTGAMGRLAETQIGFVVRTTGGETVHTTNSRKSYGSSYATTNLTYALQTSQQYAALRLVLTLPAPLLGPGAGGQSEQAE